MLAITLPLLTLALLLSKHAALGKHATCTWRPTQANPGTLTYQPYCTATITSYMNNYTGAVYKCKAGGVGPEFQAVADWGLIMLNLLEMYTPCNSDGFGIKDGGCISPRWAACLGDEKNNNCLWYSADDDCTWPQFFFYPALPDQITMWYDGLKDHNATTTLTPKTIEAGRASGAERRAAKGSLRAD